MDKAKAAVSNIMKKAGHHDTTVHETVAPAVTQETVSPTQHEHVTTAVDKEIHQDHHHTTIQPVKDREVLPERHTHQQAEVQERHFEHGNDEDVQRRRAEEAARFKDQKVVGETKQTQSVEPTVQGEHVHHHLHETIQPVVQKETIQPNVVHTTVPVHEVHHNESQHHATSALPAMSMADFKKQGGALTGREERSAGFDGEPQGLGGGTGGLQSGTTGSTGMAGSTHASNQTGTTGSTGMTNTSGQTGATGGQKASLMDKLNPKVDADGDGKAGFMK